MRDETEKQEVRDILAACDNDLVPLTLGVVEYHAAELVGGAGGDDVAAYAKTLLEQSDAL